MSTNAAATEQKEAVASAASGALALVFEIEGVACASHALLFDSAREALSAAGQKLSRPLFVRHGLQPTVDLLAAHLVEQGGLDAKAAALAETIRTSYEAKLAALPLADRFRKLLDAAVARQLPLVALTALPEELAQGLLARWKLTDKGVRLVSVQGVDEDFPRMEAWMKAGRSGNRPVRQCIGVTSHSVAMKSALAAGMRCIVMPDDFTSYQDFSGADAVVDAWDELAPKDLLDDLLKQACL